MKLYNDIWNLREGQDAGEAGRALINALVAVIINAADTPEEADKMGRRAMISLLKGVGKNLDRISPGSRIMQGERDITEVVRGPMDADGKGTAPTRKGWPGLVSSLFSTARWNDDPYSKRLAKLILDGAVQRASGNAGPVLDFGEVISLADEAGWSAKESADRFVHAVSMIKPIADARTYQEAKEIGMSLYNAYTAKSVY
jgi:hypothetical protein